MERPDAFLPDWTDAAAYASLVAADRTILAWEWLRRIPAYREASRAGGADEPDAALGWGLHRFEDPWRAAPLARPIWTATALVPVLRTEMHGCDDPADALPASLRRLAARHRDGRAVRMLLCDGWRAVRLDGVGRSGAGAGPRLVFTVAGPPALSPSLLALRRLDALIRHGRFAGTLHPPVPRAARMLLLLRTADALAAGARQREIAGVLLRGDVRGPGWREEHPHLRLQAQRLVRDARRYLSGGYRALLRPRA